MKKQVFFFFAFCMVVITSFFAKETQAKSTQTNLLPQLVNAQNNTKYSSTSHVGDVVAQAGGHSTKRRCFSGRGSCLWAISEQKGTDNQTVSVKLSLLDAHNLTVTYLEDFKSEDDGNVNIENTTLLAASLSQQLGKSSITVLKGSYSTDFSKSTYGTVTLKIVSE